MTANDPSAHQLLEQQFVHHIEALLDDDRLRIDTLRGRKPVAAMQPRTRRKDRGVDLKRLMSQLNKPDRALEATMPVGVEIEVTLSRLRWWVIPTTVGRIRFVSVSPDRQLLLGEPIRPMTAAEVEKTLAELESPRDKAPVTTVIMSTAGFSDDAIALARAPADRRLLLVSPNSAGGWSVAAADSQAELAAMLNPEAESAQRQRIRQHIDAARVQLLSGGISSEKLAQQTQLPAQLVEAELKSYARENPGLAARRLDGTMVLFREAGAPAVAAKGVAMPFKDMIKTVFSRKGDVEKKIAFLSERRAALSLQRDSSYDDMGAMETREAELRQQFKDATGDLTRRRITSQLVQLRKDIERRQQLLSVLNQQINVVSTHLHNMQLQQQGQTAKLPDTEEMAADAAKAEEVLAELQANSELADTVGSSAQGGMSEEEQALYDELMAEHAAPPAAEPQQSAQAPRAAAAQSNPPAPQRKRTDPEPG